MHSGTWRDAFSREKMSKSLGNFFTVRDVLKYYDARHIEVLPDVGSLSQSVGLQRENLEARRKWR